MGNLFNAVKAVVVVGIGVMVLYALWLSSLFLGLLLAVTVVYFVMQETGE